MLYNILERDAESRQKSPKSFFNKVIPADTKEFIDILHDDDNDISKRSRLIILANKFDVTKPKSLELLSGSEFDVAFGCMCSILTVALEELLVNHKLMCVDDVEITPRR